MSDARLLFSAFVRSSSPHLVAKRASRARLLTLVLAALGTACARPVDPTAAEIHGTWVTQAPAYQHRAFELAGDVIRLHQGAGMISEHRIRRIHRTEHATHVEYTITYGDATTVDFRLDFHPGPVPFILFPHQPRIIWERAASGLAARPLTRAP